LLVEASAAAEPLEHPAPVEVLLGLFSAAWRCGVWEPLPARVSPAALAAALGGLDHGTRLLPPDAVRKAAQALALLHPDDYPAAGTGPWRDGLDPDVELDELARSVLRDLIAAYVGAAAEGWAMRVVV
jgi:hypothetical protein